MISYYRLLLLKSSAITAHKHPDRHPGMESVRSKRPPLFGFK